MDVCSRYAATQTERIQADARSTTVCLSETTVMGTEKRIRYTTLMELVSALDEFAMAHFKEGIFSANNMQFVKLGLCSSIAEARTFKSIYSGNPVMAYFFLVVSRYGDLIIDRGSETTRVIGKDPCQKARYIFYEIHSRYIPEKQNDNKFNKRKHGNRNSI